MASFAFGTNPPGVFRNDRNFYNANNRQDDFDDEMLPPPPPVHEIQLSDTSTASSDSITESSPVEASAIARVIDNGKISSKSKNSVLKQSGHRGILAETDGSLQADGLRIEDDHSKSCSNDHEFAPGMNGHEVIAKTETSTDSDDNNQSVEPIEKRKVTGTKRRLTEIENQEDQRESQRIEQHGIPPEELTFKRAKTVTFTESEAITIDAGKDKIITEEPAFNSQGSVQVFDKIEIPQAEKSSSERACSSPSPATISNSTGAASPDPGTSHHKSVPLRPKVVFSTSSKFHTRSTWQNTFKSLGGLVTSSIENADILCIGDETLKRTSKLIKAVCYRKDIVSDGWLREMFRTRKFPPAHDFLPIDTKQEHEWGFNLAEAIERGKQGCNLLTAYTVYFTKQFKKEYGSEVVQEMTRVVMAMGAKRVGSRVPEDRKRNEDTLIIAVKGNKDTESLRAPRLHARMFWKDELILAALRGRLGD